VENRDLTSYVLEALEARIAKQSFQKEIQTIQVEIQTLESAKQKIETAQKQYIEAKGAAIRAADTAKQLLVQLDKKALEVKQLIDRTQESANQAIHHARIVEKTIDFDSVITNLEKQTKEAKEIHAQMAKIGRDIAVREEQLKRAGVDIDQRTRQKYNYDNRTNW